MTLAERLSPIARSITDAQVARKLRKEVPALGDDAGNAIQSIVDAITRAADDFTSSADRTVDHAARDAREVGKDIGATAHDALDSVQSAAGDAVSRVEDLVQRLRKDLPTEKLSSLVGTIERELPGTDKARYDRAFARGWTRARTAFVGVGLATGVAAGVAGAFLLDPVEGPKRRAALSRSVRKLGQQARGKAAWTADRAKGMAYERGILKPGTSDDLDTAPAPMVPVMNIAPMDLPIVASEAIPASEPLMTGETPIMPVGDGPVTDPSSIVLEPMHEPEGGFVGGTAEAAEADVASVDVTGLDGDRESVNR